MCISRGPDEAKYRHQLQCGSRRTLCLEAEMGLTTPQVGVHPFFRITSAFEVSRVLKWRRQWDPTSVLLPGKSHGQRSLWAAVHGVAKSWTWLSDFTFTFHFHALEKEMATHSDVLAWRIPRTGEPGGLPSMESRRVGHDWSDLAAAGS